MISTIFKDVAQGIIPGRILGDVILPNDPTRTPGEVNMPKIPIPLPLGKELRNVAIGAAVVTTAAYLVKVFLDKK